jgi:hypothetical protein
MYAVIEYYNYRKDMTFNILHVFNNQQLAIDKAKQYAELQSEEESLSITDDISNNWLYLHDCIEYFSTGNGYGRNVYAVLVLPNIEENISE